MFFFSLVYHRVPLCILLCVFVEEKLYVLSLSFFFVCANFDILKQENNKQAQ